MARLVTPLGVALLAALLALALPPRAHAQTYTNENIMGIQSYSAFAGLPSASVYTPYIYRPPPSSTATCVGVGGTCVPVTIAGTPAIGFWLLRGNMPYWITCVPRRRLERASAWQWHGLQLALGQAPRSLLCQQRPSLSCSPSLRAAAGH
jgi:hypothetical protein